MIRVRGAAAAIEFFKKAFGATEAARLPGPNGKLMHAQIRIGGSAVMLVDENPQWVMVGPKALKGPPVTIHLYVADADAFVARAVAAGAMIVMPLSDAFWGDRYGVIEDPYGHRWSVATHQRDVQPDEWAEAMKHARPTARGRCCGRSETATASLVPEVHTNPLSCSSPLKYA